MEQHFTSSTLHLKVAVIHDWAFVRRGGERVLENILALVPHADVFMIFGSTAVLQTHAPHVCQTSFLGRIPWASKFYKTLLPLMPLAAESFDLSSYDLVISSSHCVAKGVIVPPQAVHVSYIHSPMRYVWDQEHRYFKNKLSFLRPFEVVRRVILSLLRMWDVTSAQRIDHLVCNSAFVARRCKLYYGRTASVVHPPVDLERFRTKSTQLAVPKKILLFGAWVPYKCMGQALDVCIAAGFQVIAAGQGKELLAARKRHAHNPLAEFVIDPDDSAVLALFARSHVLLMPGIEDFGIVPLEAQAAGVWVVAPSVGGSAETVLAGQTGFHFIAGNQESMLAALGQALGHPPLASTPERAREHCEKFSETEFRRAFAAEVLQALSSREVTK